MSPDSKVLAAASPLGLRKPGRCSRPTVGRRGERSHWIPSGSAPACSPLTAHPFMIWAPSRGRRAPTSRSPGPTSARPTAPGPPCQPVGCLARRPLPRKSPSAASRRPGPSAPPASRCTAARSAPAAGGTSDWPMAHWCSPSLCTSVESTRTLRRISRRTPRRLCRFGHAMMATRGRTPGWCCRLPTPRTRRRAPTKTIWCCSPTAKPSCASSGSMPATAS
mmetsp:Transcript_35401/g.92629  ORF Transcript_35401/g.92629 Transcript_35401/m.92629 type:complete len:221 (+) Transcript_35401:131-793(+)